MSSGHTPPIEEQLEGNASGVPSGPFLPLKKNWRDLLRDLLREYVAEHPDFMRGDKPSLRKFSIATDQDPTTLWGWLDRNPQREPSFSSVAKVMRFLGKPLTLLVDGDDDFAVTPAGNTTQAPLVGIVEAGVWREPRMLDLQDDLTVVPYVPDPKFKGLRQYAWRINGNSINKVAPSGSYLITVKLIDLDRDPQHGELVICTREKHGEVEFTAKRVHYEKNGVQLVPDSTDPRFQQPVWLRSDEKESDTEVRAEHLVIGMYRPFL